MAGDEIGFAGDFFGCQLVFFWDFSNQLASFEVRLILVALLGEVGGSNTFLSVHGRYMGLSENVGYIPNEIAI